VSIDRNYLYQLRHQLQERGTTEKRKKTGRPKKLITETDKPILSEIVKHHSEWTLNQISAEFEKQTGKKVSKSSIDRALTVLHFTMKMLVNEPVERNTEKAIAERKSYAKEALLFDSTNVIYIDEFGITAHSHRSRGRCLRGEAAKIKQVGSRSVNVSVLAAMSPHYGLLHYEYSAGGTNGEKFKQFLLRLMKKEPAVSQAFFHVMDNASIHKTADVKECFTGQKFNQTQIFIPAYSPHLNGIAELFGVWTTHIKKQFTPNQTALGTAIDEAAKKITPQFCENFHKHVVRTLTDVCMESKPLP
jgi:transposase